MIRVLYVGDPHARPEDLEDCRALVQFINAVAIYEKPDRIEVLAFWRAALLGLRERCPVVVLVGNHDQPGDASSRSHALMAYKDMAGVTVVDGPTVIDGILHVPYRHNPAEFIADCRAQPTKTVVCHQTFQGARYENGFYAPDGIDPEAIPQELVLSGHIHDPQGFGKVVYLGASRWLTVSDANKDRVLNIITHDATGSVSSGATQVSLAGTCRKIFHLIDTPEAPITLPVDPKDRYYVDIQGPAEWIEQRRNIFSGRARIRTQRTDKAVARVRESEGIAKALRRFLSTYQPARGTPRAALERLVDERLPA